MTRITLLFFMYYVKTIIKFLNNSPVLPQLTKKKLFGGVGLECESESIAQGRSYDMTNISIYGCFFSRSSQYSGDGGVIYISGESYSMNAIHSMFYNCECSGQGGAIYFYSANSYLRMVCTNNCSASSYDHFAYLIASQVNRVEYLSVSKCSHTTSGIYSIRLSTGDQRVDNTNSSMNNANEISGLGISSPSSSTSSHCTFSNNNVSGFICIRFYSFSGIISMSYANIVHNNSPNEGIVSVESGGSGEMIYCIFQNNQDYLFCVLSGSLSISHSFINHSTLLSFETAVSTDTNNSFTNRMTYQLQFFGSLHCNADSPLIDTTPLLTLERSPIISIEETIRRTNEETPRMTYERTIDKTISESPINTHEKTPINTLGQSINETPMISLSNVGALGSMILESTVFIVATVVILIVLIIVFFYTKGFMFPDDSSSTLDSFHENVLWFPKI